MTKGVKVAIFMAVASLGNVLVTGLIFAALLGLYSLTLAKLLAAEAVVWALLVCFVLSLVGAVLVYKKLLAILRKDGKLDAWLGMKTGEWTKR